MIQGKQPKAIYIEPTNFCNLRCSMCPQGHNLIGSKGYMDEQLFMKIADDIASVENFHPVIGLHMNGEPLLHKKISEMVAVFAQQGLYTQMHTNGMLMDKTMAAKLIEAGISEITFSFEGEDKEQYEKIRKNSKYEVVKRNILHFLSVKKSTKVIIEVLKFGGQSLDIAPSFKDQFKGASFKSYQASNWHGSIDDPMLQENEIFSSKPGLCKAASTIMFISYDGGVHPCGLDFNSNLILGDISKDFILDIWNGEKRRQVIQQMKRGEYHRFSLCKKCGAPYTIDTKARQYS